MSGRRSTARAPAAGGNSRIDSGVLLACGLLAGLGVIMSYSATAPLDLDAAIPRLFARHVLALGAGVGLAAAAMHLPLYAWRRAALPLWGVGVALLVATAMFGVEVNGAQRWLALPGLGLRFQPVELVKLVTVLAVAAVVTPRRARCDLTTRQWLLSAGVALLPVSLLLLQPDFGSALLLAILVGLLLIAAGAPLRSVVLPGLAAPAVVWVYALYNPYAWRRLVSFRDPWKDSADSGFQLVQSFIAFAHGGLAGTGLGDGRQKLYYLPEVHTDFILSLVAEELGLLGVLLVLGAFAALLVAGTRIAVQARDRFSLLAAFGATALLTVPALVNAAVVMGMLPTKGLTLPFLSYGRTSLVVSCVAAGLLLGIARRAAPDGNPPGEAGARWGWKWRSAG